MTTTTTIEQSFWQQEKDINRHDAKAFGAAFAEDAVANDPAYLEPLKGRGAIERDMADFFAAFGDLKVRLITVLTEGKTYAWEATMSGTHTGPLQAPTGLIPATNRRFESGIAAVGLVDEAGLIVEERRYYDIAGLMTQLGVMP